MSSPSFHLLFKGLLVFAMSSEAPAEPPFKRQKLANEPTVDRATNIRANGGMKLRDIPDLAVALDAEVHIALDKCQKNPIVSQW